MWTQVQTLYPNACPTHLVVDFEKAAINAFERQYPHTQVKAVFSTLLNIFGERFRNLGSNQNIKMTLVLRYKRE